MTLTKTVNGVSRAMTAEEEADFEASRERTPQTVDEWRETASLPRAEFVNIAADLGMLTDDEAIEAARGGWPTSFDGSLASLSATDKRKAKVLWAGSTDIRRNTDLIGRIIASPIPITAEQVDALFGYGG